jgi:hypothetical protein
MKKRDRALFFLALNSLPWQPCDCQWHCSCAPPIPSSSPASSLGLLRSSAASSLYTLSRNKIDAFQRRIDRAVAAGAPAEAIGAFARQLKLAAWQARVATRRIRVHVYRTPSGGSGTAAHHGQGRLGEVCVIWADDTRTRVQLLRVLLLEDDVRRRRRRQRARLLDA